MINMSDVRRRISVLTEKSSHSMNMDIVYNRAMKSTNPSNSDIKLCFNEWESLNENINVSAAMVINLFTHLCESDSISTVTLDRLCKKICENSVPKFRNAAETQHLIKRRLGRIRSKIQTKINSNVDDMKDAATNSIDAIKNNTSDNIDKIKQNADRLKQVVADKNKDEKDKKIEECFIKLNNACQDIIVCDRIIENHIKVSKRFSIDIIASEMSRYSNAYEIINEFCKLLDTYNIPLSAKVSIALENGMYLLEKNHINYDKNSDILDSVIDYNIMNTNEDNYQSIIDTLSSTISKSDLFDINESAKSKVCCSVLINSINTNKMKKNHEDMMNPNNIFDLDGYSFGEAYIAKNKPFINESKDNKVLEEIIRFKSDVKEKTVESLKSLVRKLYTNDPEDIILGQTSIFSLIRVFFVFASTCAINPVLAIVAMITDQFIAMGMKRKEIDRTITNYKNEIKKTEKKLENLKDETTKERTKKYLDKLNDGLDKIIMYRDDLHTDEENMNRDSDDDMDFNFDESTMVDMICAIKLIESTAEDIYDSKFNNANEIMKFVRNNIDKIDSDSIDSISTLFQNPIISNETLRNSFVNELFMYKNSLKKNKAQSVGERYLMMASIDDNIRLINSVNESIYSSNINGTDIHREYNTLLNYLDVTESIQEMFNYIRMDRNSILEMDFSNTLKLAADKLKKSVQKLGDTDKNISKNIDVSMNSFRQGIERSMANDNREAIIRGTILPSASKTLKIALAAGATSVIINPVLAIIGVLGYIGTSKKYKAKERQMILDEIEIEMQMVDKYMKIADDKDDLQAQKQLLTTKRQLERQQQRIKYHMRVDFGEGDVAKTTMDNDN